jgi:hypothetical protein
VEQPDLLRFAIETLDRLQITYMVVGSIASSAYGDPRLTQDIDIVIDATPQEIERLCAAFPPAHFYVSMEAAVAAANRPGSQFNVLDPSSGTKIDFMIARKDPWGIQQVARRQTLELIANCRAYAARPEDVMISKMLYYKEGGSEKHLRDIAGILRVSGQSVDQNYVQRWSAELGLEEIWNAVLARLKA